MGKPLAPCRAKGNGLFMRWPFESLNSKPKLEIRNTFADQAMRPKDRLKRRPQTRDLQLLVVHLGCTGEAGVGLLQYTADPHPETYLVWGRGDLGSTAIL